MPYIYVLFYERYSPEKFQHERVDWVAGDAGSSLYAGVAHFDRYTFGDAQREYLERGEGVFVLPAHQVSPATPTATVVYPDGSVAYRVLVK
jgi:hypothetical protein